MIEEGAVVNGDDAGHGSSCGHGVVRPVVDLHAERIEQAGKANLFEGQAGRTRSGNGTHDVRHAGSKRVPAFLVTAPRHHRQCDVIPGAQAAGDRHGVVAGTAWTRRDG
jgi:hypothetical protein